MNAPRFFLFLTVTLTVASRSFAVTHYVDVSSTNPVPPYTDWATAAAVIQDAVDAAGQGDLVLVADGVYATGGKAVYGAMTNRVAVDKPLTLLSVNGPGQTVIRGEPVPGITNGDGAVRCVYLTNGAFLSGFSLTHGATRSSGDIEREQNGGGLWCESAEALAVNCLVMGNSAYGSGGGVYRGALLQCTLKGNQAGQSGGGSSLATLENCLLVANHAEVGGGSAFDNLFNCTVVGNSATSFGGGFYSGTGKNCIIYFNTAEVLGDNIYYFYALDYSCTTPQTFGTVGTITNAPRLVDVSGWADLRLQSNSPCINAGNNAYAPNADDLDGNPRIVGDTVDMGAYEFQFPESTISYAWLQSYGLSTDGSLDHSDLDFDSHTTWQEWKTWTNPTNAQSVLRLLTVAPVPAGLELSWNSESGVEYWIEWASRLVSPPSFSVLETNLPGHAGTTHFRHGGAGLAGSALYRVGTTSTNLAGPIRLERPELAAAQVEVLWQSVAGQTYFIERANSPSAPFLLLESNLVGQTGTTRYTDTNFIGHGPYFYRVGVPK